MEPHEFIAKWRLADLKERSASQEHLLDLCRVLGEPTPAEADPVGETYCFERGDSKQGKLIGKRLGVSCTRMLALLCESIRKGLLTLDVVSDVADDLIATEYRLPFGPGEFAEWAIANELIGP